jgi:hypothetical protein
LTAIGTCGKDKYAAQEFLDANGARWISPIPAPTGGSQAAQSRPNGNLNPAKSTPDFKLGAHCGLQKLPLKHRLACLYSDQGHLSPH